jgi:hypothetical protein
LFRFDPLGLGALFLLLLSLGFLRLELRGARGIVAVFPLDRGRQVLETDFGHACRVGDRDRRRRRFGHAGVCVDGSVDRGDCFGQRDWQCGQQKDESRFHGKLNYASSSAR